MHYHYHNFWSVQWAKEHLGEMVYWWTPHHTKFFWGTGNWYSFEAGRVVAGLRERLLGWTGLPFLAFVNTCQTCKGVPILQLKTGVFLLALAIGVSSAWPEVSGTCFTLIALATFMFEKSLLYFQPQRVFTICNHCNQSKSKTAKKTACSNLSPASRWGFTGRSGSQQKTMCRESQPTVGVAVEVFGEVADLHSKQSERLENGPRLFSFAFWLGLSGFPDSQLFSLPEDSYLLERLPKTSIRAGNCKLSS